LPSLGYRTDRRRRTRSSRAIGIREMTIGNQHGNFSEQRIQSYATIHVVGPTDFDARRLLVVGNHLRVRKGPKVVDKGTGTIWPSHRWRDTSAS
jgi:hypothetical protein